MRRLRPAPEIDSVIGRVSPTADLSATAEVLCDYLKGWANGREVEVHMPRNLLDGLKRQASTFTWLLAGLGGISLLVGGVGVMNVMLMNVAERRREIGIRMALGARPRDIRNLFLLEAGALSVVGAVLGGLLGVAAAWAFTQFSGWQFLFSPESLLPGCGSSLLIGLFFGLYPAIAAARLQPVQALRDV
jgi:putative ABC transport system permease protein